MRETASAGQDHGAAAERTVNAEEAGLRLDRWFRRHFPGVPHSRLEKLLRGGRIRVDGRKAHAGDRIEPGQRIRIPPLDATQVGANRSVRAMGSGGFSGCSAGDSEALRSWILYEDDAVVVLDKPPGLAVQGGSGTRTHLDGMLDLLAEGGQRPRLVHRLDKDTSGVIVLARSAAAAASLSRAFRERRARKIYWAIVVGVPKPPAGLIDLPLAKRPGRGGERMQGDVVDGDAATTEYAVLEQAGRHAAWLELSPLTGRTHQLRVHCAAIGTPILGDGKYGGRSAFLKDAADIRALHLHARSIEIAHPGGGTLRVEAPLPAHMRVLWQRLGLTEVSVRPPQRERTAALASLRLAPAKHGHQRRQHDHGARQRQADGDRKQ